MNYGYEPLIAWFDGQVECFQRCSPEQVLSFGTKNYGADPFLIRPSDTRLANTKGFGCSTRESEVSPDQRFNV